MLSIFFALISITACMPYTGYRGYGSDPYSMGGLSRMGSLGMGSPYGMMGSPYGMNGMGMGGFGMGGIPPPMPPPGMGGLGMGTYGSPYSSLGSLGSPLGMQPFFKR